jgi:hypothetical protein
LNIKNEKDVEEFLLIPLLLNGYSENDWTQNYHKNRKERKSNSDFVFFPRRNSFSNAPLIDEKQNMI